MQLILETESTVDVHGKMSTIEEALDEKVMVNGDVEDLKDKKCNGNKENLVDDNIITADHAASEECTKVKIKITDNLLTKTHANLEVVLLDSSDKDLENSECDKPDESCAQNDESAPIQESPENNANTDVNINNSDTNHVLEEDNQEFIDDDLLSIKDTNIILPEIFDSTKIDSENDVDKEFGIDEESPVSKEDINLILEKMTTANSDDTVNIDNKLESSQKDDDSNNLNSTRASNFLTKDTEMSFKENNKPDVDEPVKVDEGTTNGIRDIPDLSHDAKESEPIELKDEMGVEKVLVETNYGTCDVANINKDVKSELIELQEETCATDPADAIMEKRSDTPNVTTLNKEEVSEPIELEHKLDVKESKEIVEDVKSEVSNRTQNTQINKDSEQLAPNDLRDEIAVGDLECILEVTKSDTCCKFKFPKLDEGTGESAIAVQDEMEVEEIKDVQGNVETKDDTPVPTRDASPVQNISEKPVSIEVQDEMEVEKIKDVEKVETKDDTPVQTRAASPVKKISEKPVLCRLSNTLDILSDDDDEEPPRKESQVKAVESQSKEVAYTQQQSINIEDDDDIMLIDEDPINETELNKHVEKENNEKVRSPKKSDLNTDIKTGEECNKQSDDLFSNNNEKESTLPAVPTIVSSMDIDIKEKPIEKEPAKLEPEKPLLPENFLLSAKKNLADMTREDLEEFCVLKIVESIVDRSSLSDIKAKLKAMTQSIDEYRKKAMMLTKQNRDLQVVLKSVQEEQKKMTDLPITPLKITRSVGMQVLMTDKLTARRKTMLAQAPVIPANNANRQTPRPTGTSPRLLKPTTSNQTIPVPRLVPANSPAIKPPSTVLMTASTNIPGKPGLSPSSVPNGIKPLTPAQKAAEKRQHNRLQSFTVDLTDDEPPAKINSRNSPAPPVRLVPPQNLMPPQRQPFAAAPAVNSPRKVYIPISGPQNQAIRPGQTIMLKSVPSTRPKCTPPAPSRVQNSLRRVTSGRHPAPLPDAMKQYQPPNWKALPPAPDLRLSKVENGIVISWKIEGYQEDSYEEIASYQLYAYQETSSPPSTTLWKKIGDVKALPLPMACTLTQFMAGFKYFFAVRAVDVKSRLGPFSLPGSILLLNKL